MPANQDLDPLLETQQNDLMMLTAQGDAIDNKSLAILAIDVTVLIFMVENAGFNWRMLAAGLPFVLSIAFAALALQPKKYLGASVDLYDHPEYLSLERRTLLLQLLADTQEAIMHNHRINRTHWRRTVISALAAIGGAVGILAIL